MLLDGSTAVGALLIFALVAGTGLVLGSFRIRGIGLGIAGVLYLTLCGLLAGSMTDPPALSFANNVTGSDAPSLSYATVYPLTMILRVLSAQLLVLYLVR